MLISEVLVSLKKINTYDVEEEQTVKEEIHNFSSDVLLRKRDPPVWS